ncbi:MAG: HlyD family efflux transporter periplasmic adaptor subunit [Planctomycetota bacterium]
MDKRLVGMAVLAVLLVGVLTYSQRRGEPLHVSGFIEADEIRIGSRVGGRVHRVHVDEGQAVRAGDKLVELEPYQLEELLAEAESQLARAAAVRDKLKAGFRVEEIAQAKAHYDQLAAVLEKLTNGPRKEDIAAAQAQFELAESALELARTNHQKAETLFARKVNAQTDLDQAVNELRFARATQAVRSEELNKLQRGTRPEELAEARAQLDEANQVWLLRKSGYRAEEVAEAEAATAAAEATKQAMRRQIEELVIKAPVDGTVEALELRPGDLVGANAPVISLMESSRLWVRAYVPENRLALKIGDAVAVTVDSFPGERFAGKITFISRQAEFTPGNVQTPEERSKQVFRIKVTLDEGRDRLRPGMAADVWLAPASK